MFSINFIRNGCGQLKRVLPQFSTRPESSTLVIDRDNSFLLRIFEKSGGAQHDSHRNLKNLVIRNCDLKTLPPAIGEFRGLEKLTVENCGVEEVPETLFQLPDLQHLSLEGNRLKQLPPRRGDLPKLTFLNLSNNAFQSPPEFLADCENLRFLYLNKNPIADLSDLPRNLNTLHMSDSSLSELPRGLGGLESLEELKIAGSQFKQFPSAITSLPSIKRLGLQNNYIGELPEDVSKLTTLNSLHLSNNPLTKLPDWIGSLRALTSLRIDGTRIGKMPGTLLFLPDLEECDLQNSPVASSLEEFGSKSWGDGYRPLHITTSSNSLYLGEEAFTGEVPESRKSLKDSTCPHWYSDYEEKIGPRVAPTYDF